VAKDHQLLLIARDCFQFVATFSEVISLSATHIYHSALELSPLTSIVRKLYHHQKPYPSPRVVIGIGDSWQLTNVIPNKDSYHLSSTWSPCGQLVAVVDEKVVVVRDALTLNPLSTPQSSKATTSFRGGLAYSPDGSSLAGCSDSAIIVWDTQTGGEVTRVECEVTSKGLQLMWSNDGEIIAAVSPWESETITIHTYSIASGTILSFGKLKSKDKPYIWADKKSFQIMVTIQDEKDRTFNIFEVGNTLTKAESFPSQSRFSLQAFSPTTFRASVSCWSRAHPVTRELHILDIRNSEVLLLEKKEWAHATFSPDANLFAATFVDHISIWKYGSGYYVQWKKFQQTWASLQFSPTSSSILGTSLTSLYILHLDHFPAALAVKQAKSTHSQIKDALSPHGTYVATAFQGGSTITITNLQSQNPSPSQFIDTELEISTIVLTGNVLMVKSPDKIVAWLLTEDGVVDGIIGNTRADYNDRLWELSISTFITGLEKLLRGRSVDVHSLAFSAVGEIVTITLHGFTIHAYHTGTGEVIKERNTTQSYDCASYRFHNEQHFDECNIYHNSLYTQQGAVNGEWGISKTALKDGWVRDPEGKHRLWLPHSWRQIDGDVNWLHSTTTLRLQNDYKVIIIKF
jgi:hypothetical protein